MIFPFPELGYVSSDLSACLSIRETEIIGENGEQHAVGKETSSLHHKDHVGKLLIVQVSGPESISFARGRWTKTWKIWFLRCHQGGESNYSYKEIVKTKYGLEHVANVSHRNVQNRQQHQVIITMYFLYIPI